MAEEIQEAVQIIRVAYDGIEIAMKVGSGGIAAMQKAIDFLKGMLSSWIALQPSILSEQVNLFLHIMGIRYSVCLFQIIPQECCAGKWQPINKV